MKNSVRIPFTHKKSLLIEGLRVVDRVVLGDLLWVALTEARIDRDTLQVGDGGDGVQVGVAVA